MSLRFSCKPHHNTKKKEKTYSRYKKLIRKELKHTNTNKRRNYKMSEINNKVKIISPYLSIITLNVHELNSPIKRNKATEFTGNKIQQCTAYMIHVSFKGTQRLKWRHGKRIFMQMLTERTKVSILISNKMHIYSLKISQKRKRRLLNSVKEIGLSRAYNNATMLNVFESNIWLSKY